MRTLGNKNEARKLAKKAGVPVVPGSDGLIDRRRRGAAARPRRSATRCSSRRRPAAAAAACASPATTSACRPASRPPARRPRTAFKDGSVYLEKYIEQPRHVEVQILGRPPRQRRPPLGARLLAAAAPPEAGRGIAGPEPAARGPRGDLRGRRAAGQGGRLLQRRHLRVPRRQGQQLLLHRGQRPHPGRAPGHRAGHRHRPGQASRSASPPASSCASRRRTSCTAACAIECRINAEDPAADFRPSPGADHALAAAGRPGRAAGLARRHRLPVPRL